MKLSIVIPVFRLKGRESSLVAYMKSLESELSAVLQFVLVDDASPDDALAGLKLEAEQLGLNIRCLKLDRRAGQYTATAIGLAQVAEGWAITVDDDGQHGSVSVVRLVEFAQSREESLVYGCANRPVSTLVWALKWILTWGYKASKELSSLRLIKIPFAHHGKTVSYLDGELMDSATGVASIEVPFSVANRKDSSYNVGQKWGIALRLILFHNRLPWYFPALLAVLLGFWSGALACMALLALGRFGSALYQRPISWSYL